MTAGTFAFLGLESLLPPVRDLPMGQSRQQGSNRLGHVVWGWLLAFGILLSLFLLISLFHEFALFFVLQAEVFDKGGGVWRRDADGE